MKRSWIAAAALVSAQALAADVAKVPPLQIRMDGMFQPWTKGNVPGCAAGVVRNGKWLAKGGYGSASLEHGVRITPDTVFNIASVSKQFTAAALLRLVDQGKVRLDDDIRTYVPELPEYKRAITLGNLVHHTSGLVDYFDLLVDGGTLTNDHGREEILGMIAGRAALFPAGQSYAYSNTNYFLIAEVVQRASGKPLGVFARENLFEPLGMKDTRYYEDLGDIIPRYASGYMEQRPGYRVVKTLYHLAGAGGVLTTINDLAKWTRVFDDDNAIPQSPGLGRRLQERGVLADGSSIEYAFGLLMTQQRDVPVATHAGYFRGYRSTFTWIPKERMAVFALCNWSEAPMSSIGFNLFYEALRDSGR